MTVQQDTSLFETCTLQSLHLSHEIHDCNLSYPTSVRPSGVNCDHDCETDYFRKLNTCVLARSLPHLMAPSLTYYSSSWTCLQREHIFTTIYIGRDIRTYLHLAYITCPRSTWLIRRFLPTNIYAISTSPTCAIVSVRYKKRERTFRSQLVMRVSYYVIRVPIGPCAHERSLIISPVAFASAVTDVSSVQLHSIFKRWAGPTHHHVLRGYLHPQLPPLAAPRTSPGGHHLIVHAAYRNV